MGDELRRAGVTPVILSWSGGKDSALALHRLKAEPEIEVVGLLTTITRDDDRISMHGVRRALLEAQAESLGLPLLVNHFEAGADNAAYEASMGQAFSECRARGVTHVAFGDLFLADIRAYRDRLMAAHGMTPLYPTWRADTDVLVREFIAQGFRAVLCCVDPKQLEPRFVGREIDLDFLAELPPGVDPCGENGEFHSFVFDGPDFAAPVPFTRGEVVERDFSFAELLPA
jgi:uncharacterized protein (TIGR00290 family)